MTQTNDNVLAVTLTCPSTIEKGDVVILDSTALTVKKVDAAGSLKIVGTVDSHAYLATECTIATRFARHRTAISGAAIAAPGPFVWNAAAKAIPYDAGTHDPAAIVGLVITTANGADVSIQILEL